MNNQVFVESEPQWTLKTYTSIASRVLSLIAEGAEGINEIDEIFSVVDLSVLLNRICEQMSGAFKVEKTSYGYYQIVYKLDVPDAGELESEETLGDFVGRDAVAEHRLWVSEKALVALIDHKLSGVTTQIYFYLGDLMTRDETFSVSPHITFERILKGCDGFPGAGCLKHRTTVMRALADLQEAGLLKWHAKGGTFELVDITPYDPTEKDGSGESV